MCDIEKTGTVTRFAMLRWGAGVLLLGLLPGFSGSDAVYRPIRQDSFQRGETLKFKMTFGIFTVGQGLAHIDGDNHRLNGRDCYKVDVYGKTVGLVSWVKDIDDQWGAYIDTAALVPHQFYRKIREGSYARDEITVFDHRKGKISVRSTDRHTGRFREPKVYDAPSQVRDMIGGYLYLRAMDFSKLKVNDTIRVTGFLEDEFYHLPIVYKGKKTIKTKIGRVRTLAFRPVMPDNKVFDGKHSVTAYFSDDKNRIPVKIEADMFVGNAGVELTDYEGLRHPLNIARQ